MIIFCYYWGYIFIIFFDVYKSEVSDIKEINNNIDLYAIFFFKNSHVIFSFLSIFPLILILFLLLIGELIFELSSIIFKLFLNISYIILIIKMICDSRFFFDNILLRMRVIFSPSVITFSLRAFISYSINSYSCSILVVFSTISFSLLSFC